MEKSSAHLSSPLKSLLSEINEEKSVKLTLKARDALMLVLLLSAPDVTRAKVKLPEHFEFSDRLVRLLRKALSIDSPHYPDLIFEAKLFEPAGLSKTLAYWKSLFSNDCQ